ncbi:MAG: cyclase family protein [Clostridia bacterium]|nr:cyclase family protein [Clostridia bacterium]MBR6553904.1 cyclase family protein [Clostridia bacterium]
MKLYDISQEVFSCKVYPGDPAPRREVLCAMERGDLYNLTAFSMCAHNGTHLDAPAHFIRDGKTVEQIPLEKLIGVCLVAEHHGELTSEDAQALLAGGAKRILLKGDCVVTLEAAEVFAASELYLLGVEPQTVGPEEAPMAVHKTLLTCETVLLEGLRLGEISPGRYLLMAQPLALEGADGAPCRAVLAELHRDGETDSLFS